MRPTFCHKLPYGTAQGRHRVGWAVLARLELLISVSGGCPVRHKTHLAIVAVIIVVLLLIVLVVLLLLLAREHGGWHWHLETAAAWACPSHRRGMCFARMLPHRKPSRMRTSPSVSSASTTSSASMATGCDGMPKRAAKTAASLNRTPTCRACPTAGGIPTATPAGCRRPACAGQPLRTPGRSPRGWRTAHRPATPFLLSPTQCPRTVLVQLIDRREVWQNSQHFEHFKSVSRLVGQRTALKIEAVQLRELLEWLELLHVGDAIACSRGTRIPQ